MENTKKVCFAYLNHYIEIQLPEPKEDNTIYVNLWRADGTYDASLYNAYLTDYQFSATNNDPNQWLTEAISSAINVLANWGIKYYEPPSTPETTNPTFDDIYDIPF